MKYYEYTNPHPESKKNLGDCVYRALSIATGKDWLTIYDELSALGREMLAPPNDTTVYSAYLDKIAERVPAIVKKKRVTANNLARLQQQSIDEHDSVHVIRTAHHLATVRDGKLRDTWDSSDKAGYIIWKIK